MSRDYWWNSETSESEMMKIMIDRIADMMNMGHARKKQADEKSDGHAEIIVIENDGTTFSRKSSFVILD